jgi:hypothetical protein
MHVIPARQRQKQEDHDFEVSSGKKSRRLYLKNKIKTKELRAQLKK